LAKRRRERNAIRERRREDIVDQSLPANLGTLIYHRPVNFSAMVAALDRAELRGRRLLAKVIGVDLVFFFDVQLRAGSNNSVTMASTTVRGADHGVNPHC
jgi:hypothetical protein